jgi:hypothetical protein
MKRVEQYVVDRDEREEKRSNGARRREAREGRKQRGEEMKSGDLRSTRMFITSPENKK